MISSNNKMIQVKVSKLTYQYLKKYSEIFGVSISNYANEAITSRIIASGALVPENMEKLRKEAKFISLTYKESK